MEKNNSNEVSTDSYKTTILTLETEEKEKEVTNETNNLSNIYIFILFMFLISSEFIMNISSGLISSCSNIMKESLEISDTTYGYFGTSNNFGKLLGSLSFSILNKKLNIKNIIVYSILLKSFLLMSFALTNNIFLLIFIRGLIGIFRQPISIYNAVWIDKFGFKNYKILMMSTIQFIQPGGKVLGYIVHLITTDDHWKYGFIYEASILCFFSIFFLFTPNKYFTNESKKQLKKQIKEINQLQSLENETKKKEVLYNNEKNNNEINNIDDDINNNIDDDINDNSNNEINNDINNNNINDHNDNNEENENFFENCKKILKNKLYIYCLIVRSLLFGVNSGIHYWFNDYLLTVLEETNQKKRLIGYFIVATLGPLFGIIGNYFIGSKIGEYNSKKAISASLLFHIICCIFCIIIPFIRNLIIFLILMWLYFTFNSFVIPIIQGIIICSVDKELKITSFALANIFQMIFTSGPAPTYYGFVNDLFHDKIKNAGMIALLMFNIINIFFIFKIYTIKMSS